MFARFLFFCRKKIGVFASFFCDSMKLSHLSFRFVLLFFAFERWTQPAEQKQADIHNALKAKHIDTAYIGFGMQIWLPLVERSLTKPKLQMQRPGLVQTPFTHGSGQCGLHLAKRKEEKNEIEKRRNMCACARAQHINGTLDDSYHSGANAEIYGEILK